jgi:nitrous oxide reductase accessory protein NosL
MGGGFAAFLDRKAAERVATERNGRVARFPDFAADRLSGAKDAPASGIRP